ncbi:MAG: carboxypeptidase regulatory-like domain-containing protein [Planctomycetes bacterium]|nr:carboxypeptidase regulatory-like domain-containing protein [Planctomycetota bacterium]
MRAALVACIVAVALLALRLGRGESPPPAGIEFLDSELEVVPTVDDWDPGGQRTAVDPPPDTELVEPTPVTDAVLTLTGRAVEPSGRPLAGAVVRLELVQRGGRTVRLARHATTGADGGFSFRGPLAGSRAVLALRARGFAPLVVERAVPWAEAAGAVQALDVGTLQLRRGSRIVGTVVDGDSRALAGATIELRPGDGNRLDLSRDWRALLPPATSDRGGSYSFGDLAAGRYRLRAQASGFVRYEHARPIEVPVAGGPPTVVDIRMVPATRLTGVVVDTAGRAIVGAEVRASNAARDAGAPRVRAIAHTAGDGSFTLDGLPRTALRIDVAASGHLSEVVAPVFHDPASPPWRITLRDGMTLTVRATDAATGMPVERYALRAAAVAPGMELPGDDPTVPSGLGEPTDRADGRAELGGLDAGTVQVELLAPGYRPARSAAITLVPDRPPPRIELRLTRAAELTGVVLAAEDGAPLTGLRVALAAPAPVEPRARTIGAAADPAARAAVVAQAVTGADGSFAFPHAGAGSWCLTVGAAGRAAQSIDLDLPAPPLRIALERCAELHGRVLLTAGERPDAVRVIAYGGPELVRVTMPDATAGFALADLPPGRWLVDAVRDDPRDHLLGDVRARVDTRLLPAAGDLALAPGQVAELDLPVARVCTGAIAGSVSAAGRALPGCRIALRPVATGDPRFSWPDRGWSTRSDAEGRFALDRVPCGDYELLLATPDGAIGADRRRVTIAPGPPSELALEVEPAGGRGRAR